MQPLIEQLKFEEGLRLKAYLCPAKKLTIGYGHNLDARPTYNGRRIPQEIDRAFAEELLEDDVYRTTDNLCDAWSGLLRLSGARRDACVNIAFQLGIQGFMHFVKMRAALDRQRWALAYAEAMDSRWAKQTPARASRVARQFLTGVHYLPGDLTLFPTTTGKTMKQYLRQRFQEPSTLRGLIWIASAFGLFTLSDDQANALVATAMALAGAGGMLPDARRGD